MITLFDHALSPLRWSAPEMEPLGWFDRSISVPSSGISASFDRELGLVLASAATLETRADLAVTLDLLLASSATHGSASAIDGTAAIALALSLAASGLRHPRLRNGFPRRRRGIVRRIVR